MILRINDIQRKFTDVRTFREQQDLPETFGVATFEPKDYAGLASLDHTGDALTVIRNAVLAAIPEEALSIAELMDFIPALTRAFERALFTVNERVNLKTVEIDFAVSGFSDVLHRLLYARIESQTSNTPLPDFMTLYQAWLDDSARVSSTVHQYLHQDTTWQVQIVNHAYGRVGLIIRAGEDTYYVRDGTLACPAEGYMTRLLTDVGGRLI